MTPDLSYYWEEAREWCEDENRVKKKKSCKGSPCHYYHTQDPHVSFSVFFLICTIVCVHSSLLIDYLSLVQ